VRLYHTFRGIVDTTILIRLLFSALTGAEDPVFQEFFGAAPNSRYRKITARFYDLQVAEKYANTQEQQPQQFSFTCIDEYNGCVNANGDSNNVGAYVKSPERYTVTFCPTFFSSRMKPLREMCAYPSRHPSNDAYYYSGTKAYLLCNSVFSHWVLAQALYLCMSSCT
jgi:hypothetical protein